MRTVVQLVIASSQRGCLPALDEAKEIDDKFAAIRTRLAEVERERERERDEAIAKQMEYYDEAKAQALAIATSSAQNIEALETERKAKQRLVECVRKIIRIGLSGKPSDTRKAIEALATVSDLIDEVKS